MKNLTTKDILLYAGAAVVLWKVLNTKINVSSGLTSSATAKSSGQPCNCHETGSDVPLGTIPMGTAQFEFHYPELDPFILKNGVL